MTEVPLRVLQQLSVHLLCASACALEQGLQHMYAYLLRKTRVCNTLFATRAMPSQLARQQIGTSQSMDSSCVPYHHHKGITVFNQCARDRLDLQATRAGLSSAATTTDTDDFDLSRHLKNSSRIGHRKSGVVKGQDDSRRIKPRRSGVGPGFADGTNQYRGSIYKFTVK